MRNGYARNYFYQEDLGLLQMPMLCVDKLFYKRNVLTSGCRFEGSSRAGKKLNGIVLVAVVKVDPEGRMYGSVSHFDISKPV